MTMTGGDPAGDPYLDVVLDCRRGGGRDDGEGCDRTILEDAPAAVVSGIRPKAGDGAVLRRRRETAVQGRGLSGRVRYIPVRKGGFRGGCVSRGREKHPLIP